MKKYLITLLGVMMFCSCGITSNGNTQQSEQTNQKMEKISSQLEAFTKEGLQYDTIRTPRGRNVSLIFIKHGSIAIDVDGYLIYIDPVTIFGNDFANLPKADMIMVTHEHHDHFDTKAIEELTTDSTQLVGSRRITELYGKGTTLLPGESIEVKDERISVLAMPAYNITEDHLMFHPRERQDVGFLFEIDGLRIYVAGDTENIPEMADLRDIDVAFLPVNQPYTMTPQQAVEAVEAINPKVFYPYHYGETDLTPIVDRFKNGPVEVRVRQLQ